MKNNLKLELTWIGKYDDVSPEPRILIENKELSNISKDKDTKNMLIHGDNLLALKALEQEYSGKIKCIYIDPPYNTGSAFEHYDDNVEHSIWLSLMKERLIILKNLLSDNGSIWISIDADESHYLKVLCDEIFGRNNFIDEVVWQRAYSPINLKKTLSRSHDTILVYAKNFDEKFRLNGLPRSGEALARYKNPDNDPRGLWQSDNLWVGPRVESNVFEIITPSGRSIFPPAGYSCRLSKERYNEFVADNRIWFGENGDNTPRLKRFLSEVKNTVVAMTWWTRDEVGDNQEAKREIKALKLTDNPFDTPKPERLIERILTIATDENDLVLDSFLGSGTTISVAQKMKRRWIGIEMEDTAYSCCKKRMDMVIDGADQGGVTKSHNWQGGGGYKFYELAPSLLKKDRFGCDVINPDYSPEMLAASVCKHEGFVYNPDPVIYWKQASYDSSFLYVTTQHLTANIIESIHNEMKDDEYLLIVAKSFEDGIQKIYKNINIKKIPQYLLGKCEFGKDNYNLNIISMLEEDLSDE